MEGNEIDRISKNNSISFPCFSRFWISSGDKPIKISRSCSSIKIFASGSSALQIYKGSHDLTRRASVYPSNLKSWDFGCAKAPGFDLPKSTPYYNIGSISEVESRELSRGPNPNFSGCLGIVAISSDNKINLHVLIGFI